MTSFNACIPATVRCWPRFLTHSSKSSPIKTGTKLVSCGNVSDNRKTNINKPKLINGGVDHVNPSSLLFSSLIKR